MEAPGTQAKADELIVPKARALANYIETGKHLYATLVEIRRDAPSGVETVVFDVVVELSQTRVHEVLDGERLAASFDPADATFPEVISLRDDFPWVPHLNHRDVEIPRSLCLYELPYTTVKLRWTPTVFIERIREWLSLTSEGKLHQDDQPLENVFLGQFPPLIYPSNFLKSIVDGGNDGSAAIHFGVFAVGDDPESITGFVVADPTMQHVAMRPNHIATAVIAPARKHGLISRHWFQTNPANQPRGKFSVAKNEMRRSSETRETTRPQNTRIESAVNDPVQGITSTSKFDVLRRGACVSLRTTAFWRTARETCYPERLFVAEVSLGG